MFERPDVGERAILVHIEFSSHEEAEDLGEFRELVWSAGVEPVPANFESDMLPLGGYG